MGGRCDTALRGILVLNCSTYMSKEDFGDTALMLRLPFAIHKPIMCDPRHLQFHIYELLCLVL